MPGFRERRKLALVERRSFAPQIGSNEIKAARARRLDRDRERGRIAVDSLSRPRGAIIPLDPL